MNTSACIPERKSFKKFVKNKELTQTSLENVCNLHLSHSLYWQSFGLCSTNVFCFQELIWNWLMTKKKHHTKVAAFAGVS